MTPFCLTLPKLVWFLNLDSMFDVSPLASSSHPPRSRRPRSTATPSPPPPIASTFALVPARSAPANSFTARVNLISDSKFLSNPTSSNPIAVSLDPRSKWLTSITSRKRQAATAAATVDAFGAVVNLGSSEAGLRPRDVLRRPPRPQPPPATTTPPPREEAAILSQMRRGSVPRPSLLLLLPNLFLSLPSFNHSQVFQTIFLK